MLRISDIKVSYFKDGMEVKAVNGVRLKIPPSSVFALVGESGCGKTTLGLSITGLIDPADGRVLSGSVVFEGQNILRLPHDQLRDIRGRKISYIFQEPASSLNPVFTIGEQVEEALLAHKITKRAGAKGLAITALKDANLDEPERVYRSFPHQLSGGMKQRAMIAMAISMKPRLLIADEPTTALDVDTESKILDLLLSLRDKLSLSILLITHDIRLLMRVADMAAVMYQGRIVEAGDVKRVFTAPRHHYTRMLLNSLPERLREWNYDRSSRR